MRGRLAFVLSDSVALLADMIHDVGDALTALPLGMAFLMCSQRAELDAGLSVVAAIFTSACLAGVEAIQRLIQPQTPGHPVVLAAAGALGYAGNRIAGLVRPRADHRLHSLALTADRAQARADADVSLTVIASAIAVALGCASATPPWTRDHARDPSHHPATLGAPYADSHHHH